MLTTAVNIDEDDGSQTHEIGKRVQTQIKLTKFCIIKKVVCASMH